ncbi:protein kinase [Myxococcota bacterium]|nr:protein kinase [Myxococcota bacterium]MBU1413495.1 protein kinase [Myxococcota bacterium]MBU1509398.1 protein kinase [Myxococcota bacterium]
MNDEREPQQDPNHGEVAWQSTIGAQVDAPVSGMEETLEASVENEKTLAAGPSPGTNHFSTGSSLVDLRYQVVRELGRGGMGRVLLVHDSRIRRQVALKDMLGSEGGDSGTDPCRPSVRINRFLREIRLSGHLEHPSIVPIYDQGESDGRPYYTMRYIQGRSFSDALKACRSPGERLSLLPHFRDVCNAMAYAHSRNIIHRDLKPANVVLGGFGETMVVDWGLARMNGDSEEVDGRLAEELRHLQQDADDSQTVFGAALGTPAYMAPEQALGMLDRIDHQSDIYSLGAMLYEILTGEPPFTGGPLHHLLYRVVSEPFEPVRVRAPEAPAELAAIAEKALQKEKSDRYDSCTTMTADLSAWLSGEKVSTYNYSNWEILRRFIRKNRAMVAAASLGLIVLIATTVLTTWAWRQESRSREQTQVARDREVTARLHAQERKEQAETALAQKIVEERKANHRMAEAFMARAEQLFTEKYYLDAQVYAAASALFHPGNPLSPHHQPGFCMGDIDCVTLTARVHGLLLNARTRAAYVFDRAIVSDRLGRLRRTMNEIDLLHPSPDGRFVIPTLEARTVLVLEVSGGKVVLELTGLSEDVAQVSFDATGARIIAIGGSGELTAWEFPSGKRLFQTATGLKGCFFLAPLPGTGDLVLATEDGQVMRVDSLRSSWRSLAPQGSVPLREAVVSPSGRWLLLISPENPIQVHDFSTGMWRVLDRKAETGTHAAFSRREEHLVIQYPMSNVIRTLRPPDWKLMHEQPLLLEDGGHTFYSLTASLLPDDTLLGRSSTMIQLLNAGDLKVQQNFHTWGPFSMVYPSGRNLHVLSSISEIMVYSQFPFRQRLTMATLDGRVGLIQPVSPDLTVLGSWSGTAGVHDARTGVFTPVGTRRSGYIWCAALSPDGSTLLLGSFDRTVQIIDLPSNTVRRILSMEAQVTWLKFSPDGKRFHVATMEKLHTLDSASLQTIRQRPILPVFGNGPPVDAHPGKLMWHRPDPTRRELVFVIEELETGRVSEIVIPGAPVYPYNAMLLRDDWLVYQNHDNCLNVRRLPETAPRRRFCGFSAPISTVSVFEKADILVATGDDRTVRLWSLSTGRPILVIPTVTGQVAALSPDGRFLMIEDGFHALKLPLDLSILELSAEELLKKAEQSAGLCLDGTRLKPLPQCGSPLAKPAGNAVPAPER